jgi:hypothetical protein
MSLSPKNDQIVFCNLIIKYMVLYDSKVLKMKKEHMYFED